MVRAVQATMHSQGFEHVGKGDVLSDNKNEKLGIYSKQQQEQFKEATVDQISSVRYRPAFKYYDNNGAVFEYPEIFYGRVVGKRSSVRLTSTWVKENFSEKFVSMCKARALEEGFVPIPVGKAKDMEEEIPNILVDFCHRGNPRINYPQQDLPTCYTASLASALFTVKGLEDAAEAVHEYGLLTCQDQNPDLPKQVNALIRDSFGKKLRPKKWSNFDPFKDSTENPVTCVLLGSDGGTSHAVTFFNNKIFEANLPFAVDICYQALNWCVSSAESEVVYDKCVICYCWVINHKNLCRQRTGKKHDSV